jgi:hypothetical protein
MLTVYSRRPSLRSHGHSAPRKTRPHYAPSQFHNPVPVSRYVYLASRHELQWLRSCDKINYKASWKPPNSIMLTASFRPTQSRQDVPISQQRGCQLLRHLGQGAGSRVPIVSYCPITGNDINDCGEVKFHRM